MTKRILSRVQWREIAPRKSRRVYRRLTRQCCTYTLRLSGIKREIATSAWRQWYVRVSPSQFLQFMSVRLLVTGYTAGYLAKLSATANLPHLFKWKSSVSVYFARHPYYYVIKKSNNYSYRWLPRETLRLGSNEYFSNKLILEENILQCSKNARDTDQYFCYLDILCSIFK